MDTAVVTGGAGFLGAHIVRHLLADDDFASLKIVVVDDLSGGFRSNLPEHERIEFIQGSVTDTDTVRQAFSVGHTRYVYHLAAYAAEGLSHFIRCFNYKNNLIGSVLLINESVRQQVERFIFTSSIAVYGPAQTPMSESTLPEPEDPYGIAKYAVELDLAAAGRMWNLPFSIFRPHNVYGEFQNIGDRYRNVVGIFMNQIMQGQPMTVFGSGEQVRAFTYVGDIAPTIARSALVSSAEGQTFNVGAEDPCSVNELARGVAIAMGVPDHPVVHLDARDEVVTAFSDHSRCTEVFGSRTSTPLSEGLGRMAVWAKEVGPQSSKPFTDIELTDGLPPSWQTDRT